MGKPNFSDEFKRDAVAQITERGYPVAEVSERLGVSQHSLYAWKRQLAKVVSGDASKDAYVKARYSKHYRVTAEDLAWLAQRIEELGQAIHAVCAERITRLEQDAAAETAKG